MTEEHPGLRGTWHESGQYWFCDCPGAGNMPLLKIGPGQGGLLTSKPNLPDIDCCERCQIFKPSEHDRSEEI